MVQSNYGTVYTGKQIAEQLRKSDKDIYGRSTWGGMEGSATAQYAEQDSMLSNSYQDAITGAYDSYLKNKRAIENSTLIGESKQDAIKEQQGTLEQAYQSYEQSYVQGQQQLQENYATQISDIENALLQQGEMTAKYANYHGDYYDYLVENYSDKLSDSKIWTSRFWNDKESRLSTWEELKPKMYDKEGNLTLFGVDVLDQLENQQLGFDGMESWGDFLSKTDSEVLNWAESYNPYNFTVGGSNAATFKVMTGRVSTDYEYSFLERFGGLNSEQVDTLFKPFNDAISNLESYSDEDKKNNAVDIMSDIASSVSNLDSFAQSLGINKELDEELESIGIKGGLKGLASSIENYASGTKSMGQMAGEWFADYAAGQGSFLLTGASLGSVIPGAGTAVGALVGAVIGLFWGIGSASHHTDVQRNKNKDLVNQATAAYKSAVNSIVLYAKDKEQTAQQKFLQGII